MLTCNNLVDKNLSAQKFTAQKKKFTLSLGGAKNAHFEGFCEVCRDLGDINLSSGQARCGLVAPRV